MKKLKRKGMKRLLTIHMITASIWLGSVVSMWVFAYLLFFQMSEVEFLISARWLPMIYIFVVLPASVTTMLEGLVYGIFTTWGFIKHRWIILKWILAILTDVITGAGVIRESFMTINRVSEQGFVGGFRDGGLIMGFISIQVVLLLVVMVVSMYKPKLKKVSAN